MPCPEIFTAQDAAYRESVLPSDCLARVAIEAGHPDYWYKHVGLDGRVIGMDSFGESAPAAALFETFGFTVDNVVARIDEVLEDL
jgi:transketolase